MEFGRQTTYRCKRTQPGKDRSRSFVGWADKNLHKNSNKRSLYKKIKNNTIRLITFKDQENTNRPKPKNLPKHESGKTDASEE